MLLALLPSLMAADWEPRPDLVPLYNEAVTQVNEKDLPAARRILERLLHKQTECGLAETLMNEILFREGKVAEVRIKMEDLVARFPDHPETWQLLSDASFVGEDFSRSLEAAQESVKRNPSFESELLLQRVLLRLGRYDEAMAALDSARRQKAMPELDCLEVLIWLDQEQLEKARERMGSCEQADSPELLKSVRSNLASRTGDHLAAAEAAYSFGDDAVAHSQRAAARAGSGDFEGCLEELDLVKESRYVGARLQRGFCLSSLGRKTEAEAELKQVFGAHTWVNISSQGSISGVLTLGTEKKLWEQARMGALLLVELQLERGASTEATETAAQLRQRFPDSLESHLADAEIAAATQQDPWPFLLPAVQQWPGSLRVADTTSRLLVAHGDGVPAEVTDLLHHSPVWQHRYNLSVYYYAQNRDQDCLREVDEALSLAPDPSLLQTLRYDCAAGAEDLPRLDQIRSEGGHYSASSSVHHAWLLVRADRRAEARVILEEACPGAEGALQQVCADVRERAK